jgi:hypothetical protein
MLNDTSRRRLPRAFGPMPLILVVALLVVVTALLVGSKRKGMKVEANGLVSRPSARSSSRPALDRLDLRAALDAGVKRAEALHGEAAVAVWVDGDRSPLTSGPVLRMHRMWSTSKAVVAIAVLQAVDDLPDSTMRSAMEDAIARSDNCGVRRAIVGLQYRLDSAPEGAEAAFERVLLAAEVRLDGPIQTAAAETACVPYLLSRRSGLPRGADDLGVVPQFGTAEWSEYDAVSFAHRLSDGGYGRAGEYLLRLMALPKGVPLDEGPPPPSAPPPDWGAGVVFPARWRPAWKAGWGGSHERPARFLASQIVVLRVGSVPVALAAIFVPDSEPTSDNPGITNAPRALELMFEAVKRGLSAEAATGLR